MENTPKAQKGTWTLIAPDGRKWQDESPLKVAAKEMRERVPVCVGVQRLIKAITEAEDHELISAIPSNWCDPLLTGKAAVIGDSPYNCMDIERLLNGIRDRLKAVATQNQTTRRQNPPANALPERLVG